MKQAFFIIAQIYIAILSFHYLEYFHTDTHYKNFLFHKITPGGYIQYKIFGKTIYLENLGILWVIWDFGLAEKKTAYHSDTEYLEDYKKPLFAFFNKKDNLDYAKKKAYGNIEQQFKISDKTKDLAREIIIVINTIDKFRDKKEDIFFDMLLSIPNLFIKDLPPGSYVINRVNPYNITPGYVTPS